jgi:hypothetical protein
VKDRIDSVKQWADIFVVPDVLFDQFDTGVRANIGQIVHRPASHVVDNQYSLGRTIPKQLIDDGRTDQAGTAGNQDCFIGEIQEGAPVAGEVIKGLEKTGALASSSRQSNF